MSENLKDIPEFFENSLGESLATRTDQLGAFRELGPPDLCHITKTNLKPGQKEIGSYHYVSGVDASSSASIAAYLNSLTYSVDDNGAWFGKGEWRIRGATYCCYNAFSRLDIRVEVKIPGGVESYCVDTNGERHEATNEMWQETFLSACVRAILFADDGNYRIAGYRKLDPIANVASEARFLEAAHNLFDKGWLLGSNPEVQTATLVKNHLSDALMKFFSYNFQYEPLLDFLERLYGKDPEVGALLAKAYIESDQEIKAVHLLYKTLQIAPTKYTVLHAQVDFLVSKGSFDNALRIAKFAVNCMPSEFLTWSKLASVYIELGEYKLALLALNSCPMFTYSERDQHRMLPPARTHLPIKLALLESGLLEHEIRDPESDPNLLRLPAAALHGTFLQAYSLLTKLASKIGWDELLRARSDVFVMEEEYRKAKEAEETKRKSVTIETIKQVQENRRLSALEEANQTFDSNPTASEHNGSMYRHSQVEETGALSNGDATNADVPETEVQLKSTENGHVPTTADMTADKDEQEDKQEPLEATEPATLDQTETVPEEKAVEEAATIDHTEVAADLDEVDVADEVANFNDTEDVRESEDKDTEAKNAETDDNDSNIPSGVITPSSAHTAEEKDLQNPMSKNAKKNQKKKNKKKNKNKKLTVSPGEANGNADLEEVPSPSTPGEDVPDMSSVVAPAEEEITADEKLDINSEEFAEIDITSSQPATVEVPEAAEAEDITSEAVENGVLEEPSAPESAAVEEPDQTVPAEVTDLEPAVDMNTNGSIEASDLPGLKVPVDGNGLGIQSSEALREPAEASKQVKKEDSEDKPKDKKEPGALFLDLHLKHKRLCERWLDNLFIVLYEDLRQYTVWRTEVQHYRSQQVEYHKNSTEWEILGDLATRLCHEPEAKEAYENCLDHRFSPRAWTRLLELYADEGDLSNALMAVVKLTIYHNRWYNEMTNPTHISMNLNKVISRHGLSKVRNSLTAMNLIEPIYRLICQYFDNAVTFKVDGYDF
ncbi:Chs5p-Arf1p-binding proteins-domain-containing protein [Umbelopsis sp. AD052]|nr:Chs5p-Arf1p-binding proteins-domain-containing protein [Umbelopsis sp. AD052]